MTSSYSISNLLKSFALFTSPLSPPQPFGLLCLRLALLFSLAVGYALSVLLMVSPDRRAASVVFVRFAPKWLTISVVWLL